MPIAWEMLVTNASSKDAQIPLRKKSTARNNEFISTLEDAKT